MQERPKISGVLRVAYAFRNSWNGLKRALRTERALQQEAAVALVAIPVAIFVGQTKTERALLIASVLLVMLAELFNTAIEAVVDRIGPERHDLSGFAKDVGSSAVLLSLVIACVVWGFILFG